MRIKSPLIILLLFVNSMYDKYSLQKLCQIKQFYNKFLIRYNTMSYEQEIIGFLKNKANLYENRYFLVYLHVSKI